MEPMTFKYDPSPIKTLLNGEPGVTTAYIYVWSGEPGPATCIPVAALLDDEGIVSIVATGDSQAVTIVD